MSNPVMTGMEIQSVRTLARTMDDRAAEIEKLLGSATTQINQLNWRGADRERFVRQWEDEHARRLRAVAEGLRAAANEARNRAAQQERISQAR